MNFKLPMFHCSPGGYAGELSRPALPVKPGSFEVLMCLSKSRSEFHLPDAPFVVYLHIFTVLFTYIYHMLDASLPHLCEF